jgi:enoyl-CoA hydratase
MPSLPTSVPGLRLQVHGRVLEVALARPKRRNAIDPATAEGLHEVFTAFDADQDLDVAVLTGSGGTFCAGADLKAIAAGDVHDVHLDPSRPGPLGCTRLQLSKPTVAAIEGHAVAGGLELALWCDLRVAARDAVLGVFCRRVGVPLVDGGTIRLPRLIGQSRALDLILTGRPVSAEEALAIGLVHRLVPPGHALAAALSLAARLAALPQACLRHDRASTLEQWDLPLTEALANEARHGLASLGAGEAVVGARRFVAGEGRHGTPLPPPGDPA